MSSHPINLALRFFLELAAWLALGVWGWQQQDNWLRFVLAIGIPLIFMAVWGIFRVPNDPGKAPVAIPGMLRLAFELAMFALAVGALFDANLNTYAWILGIAVTLHYISSYDRILWMLKQ